MTSDVSPSPLTEQLLQLETELKSLGCWQSEPLPPEAYESTEPFCIDRMSFVQWLQFVFLPRMRALLDGGHPLPTQMQITPLAEVYFSQAGLDAQAVLDVLARIEKQVIGNT